MCCEPKILWVCLLSFGFVWFHPFVIFFWGGGNSFGIRSCVPYFLVNTSTGCPDRGSGATTKRRIPSWTVDGGPNTTSEAAAVPGAFPFRGRTNGGPVVAADENGNGGGAAAAAAAAHGDDVRVADEHESACVHVRVYVRATATATADGHENAVAAAAAAGGGARGVPPVPTGCRCWQWSRCSWWRCCW